MQSAPGYSLSEDFRVGDFFFQQYWRHDAIFFIRWHCQRVPGRSEELSRDDLFDAPIQLLSSFKLPSKFHANFNHIIIN